MVFQQRDSRIPSAGAGSSGWPIDQQQIDLLPQERLVAGTVPKARLAAHASGHEWSSDDFSLALQRIKADQIIGSSSIHWIMIQRDDPSTTKRFEAARDGDGGAARSALEDESRPSFNDQAYRIVNQDRIGGPPAQIQGKLSEEWPDLHQGILLSLPLEHGPAELCRLKQNQGDECRAKERRTDPTIHKECQHERSGRETQYDATRPAPRTRSTEF
jgi:hypothetical protein